jgi:leucyl aminopeptidase (aminopeptidase T)
VSQYWYESVDTGFKPGRLVALQRNARILVERTLEVKKGQQVCIVADTEVSPLLAWTVAGEVAAAGGIPSVVSWEANARPGMDVPAPVGAALLAADAIVACVSRSISFSKAIQEAYLVRGIPYVVMSNATEDMLMRGAATADVDVVAAIGHRTRDALNQGTKVRVTTPHGTDVTFDTTGRPWYSYSSFFEDGAKAAVFPGGEVNTCPDEHSGEGRIVIDSFMMEIGRIREPIVWELREGRIVSIEGGEEARRLERLLADHGDENSRWIGELSVGTNYAARTIGSALEDKQVYGHVHVALGTGVSAPDGLYKRRYTSTLHLDGVMSSPTVTVDGTVVVRDGEILAAPRPTR